jgi:hypothetical protein
VCFFNTKNRLTSLSKNYPLAGILLLLIVLHIDMLLLLLVADQQRRAQWLLPAPLLMGCG